LKLTRKFRAEASKLSAGASTVISNRELANMLWLCFSPEFLDAVRNRLWVNAKVAPATAAAAAAGAQAQQGAVPGGPAAPPAAPPAPVVPIRRRDDLYEWQEILREAVAQAEEAGGMGIVVTRGVQSNYVTSSTAIPGNYVKVEQLEQVEARLLDAQEVNTKRMVNDIEGRIFNALKLTNTSAPGPSSMTQGTYGGSSTRSFGGPSGQFSGCYYCSMEGHRLQDCPLKIEHEKKGWIKNVGGRIMMPDGNGIPRDGPGKTMGERVEIWNVKRQEANMFVGYDLVGDELVAVGDRVGTSYNSFAQLVQPQPSIHEEYV
jgi:hypothetical protein